MNFVNCASGSPLPTIRNSTISSLSGKLHKAVAWVADHDYLSDFIIHRSVDLIDFILFLQVWFTSHFFCQISPKTCIRGFSEVLITNIVADFHNKLDILDLSFQIFLRGAV
ncbi:hypothetical protein Y032_0378g277 [Ancylostoma ceylanicum]|uniref:Uncharacterized protein n=1 Tax=Ancylostoma ceylanicum TaxID=53326 RepID=A0A016RTH5_9BILA|nr:hypothetical protein Y032_0378g277 [Ancylostoma ceylanicum]